MQGVQLLLRRPSGKVGLFFAQLRSLASTATTWISENVARIPAEWEAIVLSGWVGTRRLFANACASTGGDKVTTLADSTFESGSVIDQNAKQHPTMLQ